MVSFPNSNVVTGGTKPPPPFFQVVNLIVFKYLKYEWEHAPHAMIYHINLYLSVFLVINSVLPPPLLQNCIMN